MKPTSFLPDVLDPAAYDVPSGRGQSLTGTHAGPLLPEGTKHVRHEVATRGAVADKPLQPKRVDPRDCKTKLNGFKMDHKRTFPVKQSS